MNIQHLPLELQSIIREETPIYARLSKTQVVGDKRLKQLCYKNISKREFLNYIDMYQPEHFMMYDHSTIFEGVLHLEDYIITTYAIMINNKIKISKEYLQNIYDLEEYVMNLEDLYYDIITTYTIHKYLRTQCDNKDFIINEFNQHINMEGNTDLTRLFNQMKTCIYLISNNIMINHYDIKIFMVPLSVMTRDLDFDDDGNYIGNKVNLNNAFDYLDEIYNMELPTIVEFISR